jgi:ABC-type nitrate/sulfonate/bicarbonate transport system substrate-binding protein
LQGWTLVGLVMGMAAAHAAPLTLAIADLPHFSTALVAEAEGYFAAEGLELKIIHCVNGKRCLKHLTDGEAQYATVADTPIVLAALAGIQFEILATLGTASRDNRFIARGDRGIRTAADLKGKRIGIIKGTTADYFADTLLLFNGLTKLQVTLVPLDAVGAADAIVRGEVDAAALYSPIWQKAQASLGNSMVTLPNPRTFTNTINLVGVKLAAGGRDDEAIKLLKALRRADQLIYSDPPRARAVVARQLKLTQAEVDGLWGSFDFSIGLSQLLITALEAQSRWALREGLVPDGKLPDYLDFIRVGPLKAVEPKAVTLVR